MGDGGWDGGKEKSLNEGGGIQIELQRWLEVQQEKWTGKMWTIGKQD